ncbi:MAG: hypothetical protein AAGJ68_11145 [Pseudomonadota bacterium]
MNAATNQPPVLPNRLGQLSWAGQPELNVVPDQTYKIEIEQLIASNILAEERKQSRAKVIRDAFEKDPLHQAFTYMCALLKPPVPYQKWVQARAVSDGSPDSVTNLKFTIQTAAGLLAVVVDPRQAFIFEDGSNPRILAQSDIGPLCEHVLKKTGVGLLGYLAAMRDRK